MPTEYAVILSQFAQSLLALSLPILAAYLATTLKAWLTAKLAEARKNTDAQTQALIDFAVSKAVLAAEQLGGASDAKLTYALNAGEKYLKTFGVSLDLQLLRGLVEAEVKAQFGKSSGSA